MKTKTVGFIGGGRITRVFLNAFKNKSIEFNSILVYDPNENILDQLQKQFPEIVKATASKCAEQQLIVLAVHPPDMMETLANIKDSMSRESVVLSLAPKFNIDKISEVLSMDKVIRMIPNATSIINKGYNPVHFNDCFENEEKNKFIRLFRALGKTFEVEEHKLEGYAMVSAMLPTYFWFQWEAMEKIAMETGLSPEEAIESIDNTLNFAIDLFYHSDYSHEEVMDLIPVKPIGEHEAEIKNMFQTKLMGLFEKIRSKSAAEAV